MAEEQGRVLLEGVVGSTAYGLAHAGSDVDRLGVYAAPTERLFGLHRPGESVVTTAPDRTLHEAAKWCRLALSANPTASELVWLPEDGYLTRTALGEELIGIRRSFLSARAVRNAYLGYATQQFRKLVAKEARDDGPGAVPPARLAKHARHLLRLLEQGVHLHRTGELRVRVDDPARLRADGERIAARPGEAEALLAAAEEAFSSPGVLPAAPDERPAEAWLVRVRLTVLDGWRCAPGGTAEEALARSQ
ncbi:nucleotidyltransferase domain-containing protein [Streptacidiphilus fuscans]|uniref:Nucleotidyltransferase domain-containing protein n=1 Tax=Streptacidiphilus fuscans TaxID=2789292 RepID=A0A931FE96_9ACTN|nr:nucleotidyltransferase domain-containing protein [Streptacidiphilus fuscans]MBF9068406.1 nucleotidyltransferase domain-containing protein [Streptacidiphilus fuscans]